MPALLGEHTHLVRLTRDRFVAWSTAELLKAAKADEDRAKKLDGVEPKKIGRRFVVGVNREAKRLGITKEKYFSKWKDGIKNSKLTPELRDVVLSNMDFNEFYGLGVIVITIPPQQSLSYVGDDIYWRSGDATELAKANRQVASLASRFAK